MSNFTRIVAAHGYSGLTYDPFSNQTLVVVVQFYGNDTPTKSKADTVFDQIMSNEIQEGKEAY